MQSRQQQQHKHRHSYTKFDEFQSFTNDFIFKLICRWAPSIDTRSTMSFDRLPDEVVLQIFGLFSLKDLQTRLRGVSQRWRRLADDDCHYRSLLLNSEVPFSISLLMLLKYGSRVRRLHLLERTDVNSLAPLIGECRNLESLTLTLCHGGSGDDLIKALKKCHHLRAFVMRHCECVSSVSDLLDTIADHRLRKVNIRNVQVPAFVETWKLHDIEDLRLKSVAFDVLNVGWCCLSNRDTLTTLKLIPCSMKFAATDHRRVELLRSVLNDDSACETPQQQVDWLMRIVGACGNLRSLLLGPTIANELRDDFVEHVGRLSRLSTLVVSQANLVSDAAFCRLFAAPAAANLTKVSLLKCMWVTSCVLRTIAKHCPQLRKFTFEKCRHTQTSEDHEDIVALAEKCERLQRLHLFGMDICVAHVLHLLPRYLPHLVSLKYSNDSGPMDVPSFLPLLESKMPDFIVSGLQWKFNLSVNCQRKENARLPSAGHDYVCAMQIKGQTSYV